MIGERGDVPLLSLQQKGAAALARLSDIENHCVAQVSPQLNLSKSRSLEFARPLRSAICSKLRTSVSRGVGDVFPPTVPLFLTQDYHIHARLESTYMQAWDVYPDMLKELIEK